MKVKGIIFDLDGTLLDTIHDIAHCTDVMLKNHGLPCYDLETYIDWVGTGARDFIEKAVKGRGITSNPDKYLVEYLILYSEYYNIRSILYKDVDNVLDFISELKIPYSIHTNKPHEVTLKISEHYFKKWNFFEILGQRDNIPKKPDPTVSNEIAQKLKVNNEDILFVGDSSTDMKTAKAAGMIPVGVTWGYDTKESVIEHGAQYVLNDPMELISLIKKLNKQP